MFKFTESTSSFGEELQLNSISLNIDVPALKNMIHESNLEMAEISEAYNSLYEAAMLESGGEESGDAKKVKFQGLKHAGEKILKALQAIWKWITDLAKNIADRIMGLVVNNEKFLKIYSPKVSEVMKHLSSEQQDKLKYKTYKYDMNLLKGDFTSATEGLDATQETDIMKLNFFNKVSGVTGQTMKDARKKFYAALRGGAEKKEEVKFDSTTTHSIITSFKGIKEEIGKEITKVKTDLEKAISQVKSEISALDKKENAAVINELNMKRKKLNVAASLYIELLNMKLAAAVERMRIARAVYTKVGNMGVKKESAGFYEDMGLFNPLTESFMVEEDSKTILTESAGFSW